MANGSTIRAAVAEANRAVAEEGWRSTDLRMVMLAGFGMLDESLRELKLQQAPTPANVRVKMTAAVGGTAAVVLAVVEAAYRFLGGLPWH